MVADSFSWAMFGDEVNGAAEAAEVTVASDGWRRRGGRVALQPPQSYHRRKVEQQAPAQPTTAVARGQNAVHVVPADWASGASALAGAIDRVDHTAAGVQLLVLVGDREAALELARAITVARGSVPPRAVAATGAARAARILRAGSAPIVVAAPLEILGLIHSSVLKLEGLRGLVIAWADQIIDAGGTSDLEAVMAEVPKDVPRTVITATLTSAVEDLIERYARRAARTGSPATSTSPAPPAGLPRAAGDVGTPAAGAAVSTTLISYVLTSPLARAGALTRVLDDIDPPSASIYVRSDESERVIQDTLLTMGYGGGESSVRVIRRSLSEHAALLVLYDIPRDAAELRLASTGAPARIIALLAPRQLSHLRGLTAGAVKPHVSPDALDAARAREDAVRRELRHELAGGTALGEVLLLEPLLQEYDGIALAAAALRLLGQSREASKRERSTASAAAASAPPRAAPPRRDRQGGRDREAGAHSGRSDRSFDRGTGRSKGHQATRPSTTERPRGDRTACGDARSRQRFEPRTPNPKGAADAIRGEADPPVDAANG